MRAIRAGASGYLSKEGDMDLLVPALRKVAAGELDSLGDTSTLADPAIVEALVAKVAKG